MPGTCHSMLQYSSTMAPTRAAACKVRPSMRWFKTCSTAQLHWLPAVKNLVTTINPSTRQIEDLHQWSMPWHSQAPGVIAIATRNHPSCMADLGAAGTALDLWLCHSRQLRRARHAPACCQGFWSDGVTHPQPAANIHQTPNYRLPMDATWPRASSCDECWPGKAKIDAVWHQCGPPEWLATLLATARPYTPQSKTGPPG